MFRMLTFSGCCLLLLSACSGQQNPCGDNPENPDCVYGEMHSFEAEQHEAAYALAVLIKDPVVQRATVSSWIRKHASALSEQQGERFCKLLQGDDQTFCFRRLRSPHLR
jgi:hypothetical protein